MNLDIVLKGDQRNVLLLALYSRKINTIKHFMTMLFGHVSLLKWLNTMYNIYGDLRSDTILKILQ